MNDKNEITAIIFDCFGVLVSEGWLIFKNKYFGEDLVKFESATKLQKDADGGMMDHVEFIKCVAELADITDDEAHEEIDGIVTDQAMLELVASLKPHYKIGFLSNASQNWLRDFFTPEQAALFEIVAISSETGFVKPDPRAFTHVAQMLDTPIENCLLIDDQAGYCESARGVGMNAIQYKNLDSLRKDLKETISF